MLKYVVQCLKSIEWKRRKTDVPQINQCWLQDNICPIFQISKMEGVVGGRRKADEPQTNQKSTVPVNMLLISLLSLYKWTCRWLCQWCLVMFKKKKKKQSSMPKWSHHERAWHRGPQESRHFSVRYGWGVMRLFRSTSSPPPVPNKPYGFCGH